jgi:hypothetical protein
MSKQQTAVEWLVKQIENNVHHTIRIPREYFEQAKAMEKEQIIEAHQVSQLFSMMTSEQYYNEIYGGDK